MFQKSNLASQECEERASDAEVYREHFGERFVVRFEDFKLRLQANIADDGQPEKLANVSWLGLYTYGFDG